ncbi:MAG: hypothetical protein GY870_13845 [archaeon]|nr:hypothetical protein [archaeon]
MYETIQEKFTKANLELKIENESIIPGVNSDEIFQMTIEKKKNIEFFKIFFGSKENIIRILCIDPKRKQVLLYIQEAEIEFTRTEFDRKERLWFERVYKTPKNKRKYLLGRDESHLFIAELSSTNFPINTILDAHKSLKPDNYRTSNPKGKKFLRQGEWFFIPINKKENNIIENNLFFVRNKEKIGLESRGNPHIAQFILRVDDFIFVKGKIRHIDHKTLKLMDWYKVLHNNERKIETTNDNGQLLRSNVTNWID